MMRRVVSAAVVAVLAASGLLVAGPAEAQPIRPRFWGMHDRDWTTPPSVPVGSANMTTAGTYWPRVQTGRHRFDWTRLDSQVAAAEEIGAQPMVVLGQTPRFASTRPGSVHFADYPPRTRLWKRYVNAVARRYGTRLDYQVWPEPNIIENWKGTPRRMAKLTMLAGRIVHRRAPRAEVVAPAVALRLNQQQKWTVAFFRQTVGGRRVHRHVDAIAIDPFPLQDGSPEDAQALMRGIRRQLTRIGVRKPIWVNEINYGVSGGGTFTSTRYSRAKQQSLVIRTYVLAADARMARTYWLGWFKSPQLAVHMTNMQGREREPARAYAVVQSWIAGSAFRGCTTRRDGLRTCTARERREVRRIYWRPRGGSVRVAVPASARRVEDQAGRVDDQPGRSIRVDFRPRMVASRR